MKDENENENENKSKSQIIKLDESKFLAYEPFIEGLVIEKPEIMLYNLQFIIRRMLLIAICMFLVQSGWL